MIQVLDKGFVDLFDYHGNDLTVVNAARVSFSRDNTRDFSFGEREYKLIRYLLTHKHTSPFEHVVFTFHVKCPLFVRSQWMRHRTWSYNEVSRRYTSEDIDFYVPEFLRKQSKINKQASTDEKIYRLFGYGNTSYSVEEYFNLISQDALADYEQLISQGVAREQARMILPQNMYTRFYATVNLHNLLKFLELRDSENSQYEIRLYAKALKETVNAVVPVTINIWDSLLKEKNGSTSRE